MTERPAFAKPVPAHAIAAGFGGVIARRLSVDRGSPATPLPKVTARRDARPMVSAMLLSPLPAPQRQPLVQSSLAQQRRAPATVLALALSSLGHAGVVAAAVLGVWTVTPLAEVTVEAAQVTLMSEARFQAMTSPRPEAALAAAALALPAPPSAAPVIVPMGTDEPAPPVAEPAPLATPLAEDLPEPVAADMPAPKAVQPPANKPAAKPVAKAKAEDAPKPKPKAAPEPKPKKQPAAKTLPSGQESAVKKSKAGADQAKTGKAGSDKVATPSNSETKALKTGWGSKVRNRIERNKRTPKGGKGLQGTVKLRISLAPSGALQGVAVIASSGHQALDSAAVQAVQAAAPFAAAPKGLGEASYSFTLPIRFDG